MDLVTYRGEVTVNGADDTNVIMTFKLNNKAKWSSRIPGECKGQNYIDQGNSLNPISEIKDTTGDGLEDTLICNVGPVEQGNKVRHLLKDEAFNRIVNNSIGFYNESILKLKPGDADDFMRLSAARNAIITLYRGVQGMVAAGESAAKELEEAKDNLSHRGLL